MTSFISGLPCHPCKIRFFFAIGYADLKHGSADDSGIGFLCAPFLAAFTNPA